MKFPRFTTRRAMVLVALVAFALGLAGWLARRSVRSRAESDGHVKAFPREAARGNGQPLSPRAEHRAGLATKYRWASRYPWLHVPSDPPEPKEEP